MFTRMIETAFETGGELALYVRSVPGVRFHGRVQDLDGEHLALYFSGEDEGWLWTFRLEDVTACALIVNRPEVSGAQACPLHPTQDR